MANRVCLGNHPNFGWGLFISKPSQDVLTNLADRHLIFDSRKSYNSAILYKQRVTLPNGSGSASTSWTSPGFIPQIIAVETNSAYTISYGQRTVFYQLIGSTGRFAQDEFTVTATGCTITRAFGYDGSNTGTRYYTILVFNIPSTSTGT